MESGNRNLSAQTAMITLADTQTQTDTHTDTASSRVRSLHLLEVLEEPLVLVAALVEGHVRVEHHKVCRPGLKLGVARDMK